MREYPSVQHALLITRQISRDAGKYLESRGGLVYHQSDDELPADALRSCLSGKDGWIDQWADRIAVDLMDVTPYTTVVSNVAAGWDNIDAASAAKRGTLMATTPGVLTDATVDLAFASILGAGRGSGDAERSLLAGCFGDWRINLPTGWGLPGPTLGILGFGRSG